MTLAEVKEVLEVVYPDNWDIQPSFILIKFPFIEIKNSLHQSHLIKDLFVQIYYFESNDGDDIYLGSLYGNRMTVSKAEFSSCYKHSHLSTCANPTIFTIFCTGSTTFSQTHIKCQSAGTLNKELFHFFLIQLNEYLKWESLEGGPHIKMSNISSLPRIIDYINDSRKDTFFATYKSLIYSHLDFKFEDKQVKVTLLDTFDPIIVDIEIEGEIEGDMIVGQLPNGMYVKLNEETQIQNSGGTLLFKGEELTLSIEGLEDNSTKDIKKVIHPQLRKYIEETISNEATKKYYKALLSRDYFKRTSRLYNQQKVTGSNKIYN